jgi:hypothetical protein
MGRNPAAVAPERLARFICRNFKLMHYPRARILDRRCLLVDY